MGAEQNPSPIREPKGPSIRTPYPNAQQAHPSSLEGTSWQHQTAPKPARQTEGNAPVLVSGRNSPAAREDQTPPPRSPSLWSLLTPSAPCDLKSAFTSLPSSAQAFALCSPSLVPGAAAAASSEPWPHRVSQTQSPVPCPLHVCTVTVTNLPSSPASPACPLSAPAHACPLRASHPSSPLAESTNGEISRHPHL